MAGDNPTSSQHAERPYQFHLWQLLAAMTAACVVAGAFYWFPAAVIVLILAMAPAIVLGVVLSLVFLGDGSYLRAVLALVGAIAMYLFASLFWSAFL
jgi:hypothetical protein